MAAPDPSSPPVTTPVTDEDSRPLQALLRPLQRTWWPTWPQLRSWLTLSLFIALLMLIGVIVAARFLPSDRFTASATLLGANPHMGRVWMIFTNNLLVLAIHGLAAYMGGLVVREHTPLPERLKYLQPLDFKLPPWAAKAALGYGLIATTTSILLQTTRLGFILADLSASTGLRPASLVLMVLPHALLELTAVFLPLAVLLIQARRGELGPLTHLAVVSSLIALPMLFTAAIIEVYITPDIINSFLVHGH